jgi:hypothetical protein
MVCAADFFFLRDCPFRLLYSFRKNVTSGMSLVFFSLLFLILIELTARLSVKIVAGKDTIQTLREECNLTYLDGSAYKGHPFLQFTGNPSIALKGSNALGNLPPYNNFGFIGPDFHYEKPAGVIPGSLPWRIHHGRWLPILPGKLPE